MADDIAPELLEKVQSDYRKFRENDKELARISERTAAGSADGKDLDAYAVREGELLAEALHRNVSGDVLPNGKMYFNIADRVLPSVLRENYDNVADMSERIIAGMNDRAGIHIRAQRPELNEDRVNGLVNLAATADQYEDRRKEIEADVVNFSQSVGTDTVRKNADFQYQSGLSPKIHRTAEDGCCKWCSGLAGTYDYASVKGSGSDVWQRHRDCRCIVEFDPGNGRRQNAHTKAWRSDEDRAKRIQYGSAIESQRRQNGQEPEYGAVPKTWEQIREPDGTVKELSLSGTNPNYNRYIDPAGLIDQCDYNKNCTNCVVAYEMRCRGYDVVACSYRENRKLSHAPFSAWESADIKKADSIVDIENFMKNMQDGVRVQITEVPRGGVFTNEEGHTFVVVKENAQNVFKDPQIGVIISRERAEKLLNNKIIEFARIDNLEISQKGVAACKRR